MASRWSHVSVARAQIYVDRNPPRSGRRKRTKGSAATERHIYLDFITDGEARLTALRASDVLPMPITFIWTLPGRFTDLWQVDGFSIAPQRSAIMLLAIAIGSNRICADYNRIIRYRDSRIASAIRRVPSSSNTPAISVGISMTSG
jgi:hypothetical protein